VHHSDRGRPIRPRSAILSGWARRGSSRRSAASATATTTRSPRPSTVLFKAEVIHRRGPWRNAEAVEFATPSNGWIGFNYRAACSSRSENIPPAEAEAAYYAPA